MCNSWSNIHYCKCPDRTPIATLMFSYGPRPALASIAIDLFFSALAAASIAIDWFCCNVLWTCIGCEQYWFVSSVAVIRDQLHRLTFEMEMFSLLLLWLLFLLLWLSVTDVRLLGCAAKWLLYVCYSKYILKADTFAQLHQMFDNLQQNVWLCDIRNYMFLLHTVYVWINTE